jgi:hypothetical protein
MSTEPTAAWCVDPKIEPVVVVEAEKTPAEKPIPVYATVRWLGGRVEEVEAVATGWTRTAVCICWTNYGVRTMGWVAAADVRRRAPR